MAQKFKWSEEKIQQLQAEGRGKGKGADYQPWIEVTDFSSMGISRRKFSPKTGRVHHLLSNVEEQCFLLLEFSPQVVDIREQFPLKRDETRSLAAQCGIKHPLYPTTRVPVVLTCDFLVTVMRDGELSLMAISCKRADGLEKPRTIELLELERRYFAEHGIPYHLVMHSDLPTAKIENIRWCRGASINDQGVEEYPEALEEHRQALLYELSRSVKGGSLAEFCNAYDVRTGAEPGTGLRVARALLWEKQLLTDFNQPSLPSVPLAMFRVANTPSVSAFGA